MATASPISPRLVKGGIVTMDVDTSIVQTVIALQYNPESLSRKRPPGKAVVEHTAHLFVERSEP
jgi:hypothetical protein